MGVVDPGILVVLLFVAKLGAVVPSIRLVLQFQDFVLQPLMVPLMVVDSNWYIQQAVLHLVEQRLLVTLDLMADTVAGLVVYILEGRIQRMVVVSMTVTHLVFGDLDS